ncbi:uncharacterized protein CBL_00141 [Carabus blaptoides fortunei]
MTSPLWGKYCDGGHYCSAPKECCTLGCCYHALPADGMFGVWFLGQWYFWALVTAALVTLVCLCSVWKRCWHALRCMCTSGRDERASELDSTGSCYAPPQYSRCNSFHHAPPPPYAEVTSKPDLYPLVISYNGETGMKRGGSASYLMVQYFRNYILRPSGSISATSTIDSLSSSFICNAANEANTVIPPPYSCTGSLEGFSVTANPSSLAGSQMLHSASSLTLLPTPNESPSQHYAHHSSPKYQPNRTTPANGGQLSNNQQATVASHKQTRACSNNYSPVYVHNKTTSFINNIPNPRFEFNETIMNSYAKVDRNSEVENRSSELQQGIEAYCHSLAAKKALSYHRPKKNVISTENSMDSEMSLGEEHNFSELLNLSVCAPISGDMSALTGIGEYDTNQHLAELQQSYSIANSVTVSDISSLANLGTPDSPPRATSPTVEIRELLDKIQQLPQQKSPAPDMPTIRTGGIFSYAGKTTKGWLSRSAPTTPCSSFVPLFPSQRRIGGPKSHTGSKTKMDDANALLTEYDGSDDEQYHHANERL